MKSHLPRRTLRMLCRLLIGVFLFGQLAVAAYACPSLAAAAGIDRVAAPVATPPATVALPLASEPMAGCEGMNGGMDASSANLCAEHCRYGQQSDQTHTVSAPAVCLTTRYVMAPVPASAMPSHGVATATSTLAAAFPPHAILHCCFRI